MPEEVTQTIKVISPEIPSPDSERSHISEGRKKAISPHGQSAISFLGHILSWETWSLLNLETVNLAFAAIIPRTQGHGLPRPAFQQFSGKKILLTLIFLELIPNRYFRLCSRTLKSQKKRRQSVGTHENRFSQNAWVIFLNSLTGLKGSLEKQKDKTCVFKQWFALSCAVFLR